MKQYSGVILVISYAGSMACLNLAVKLVSANVHTIMFCRYNIALLLSIPLLFIMPKRKCPLYLHILRGLGIFAANFFTYYGHKHASFINANIIGMSEPFFVLFFTLLINFKLVTRRIFTSLLIGYIGVIIIIMSTQHSDFYSTTSIMGNISILVANILSATFIFVSSFLAKNEAISTTLFHTTFILWCCGWLIKPDFSVYYSLQIQDVFLLILIGLIAVIGHYLAILGLSKLTPETYSPFLYSRLIFGLGLAMIIFGETISWEQILGSTLIIIGLYRIHAKNIIKPVE